MKYLIVVLTCLGINIHDSDAATGAIYRFQNGYGTGGVFLVNAPVSDSQGNLLFGPGYLAELWGGAFADSLAPAFRLSTLDREIKSFDVPGYVTAQHFDVYLRDVPPGGYGYVQMRAWDARLGPTYEDAVSKGMGGYGDSNELYLIGGSDVGNPTLPTPLIGLQPFSLLPVPEPSTWALLAFGTGALCWKRWRRNFSGLAAIQRLAIRRIK